MLRCHEKVKRNPSVDIVSTFLGPHSVLPQWKGKEREFLDEQLEHVMPKVKEEDLAEFADIFTEKNVFNGGRLRVLYDKSKGNGLLS